MKKVEERTTPDLLELTLQLHSRALNQPNNKEMHEAYVEASQELEKRLPVNENAVLRSVNRWAYLYDNWSAIMLGFGIAISFSILLNMIENIIVKIALIIHGG